MRKGKHEYQEREKMKQELFKCSDWLDSDNNNHNVFRSFLYNHSISKIIICRNTDLINLCYLKMEENTPINPKLRVVSDDTKAIHMSVGIAFIFFGSL